MCVCSFIGDAMLNQPSLLLLLPLLGCSSEGTGGDRRFCGGHKFPNEFR